MSLYNLDRFRFERKRKSAEQETASPSAAQVRAANSAAAGGAAGGDEDEATDDSNRPDTPASDVTERTEQTNIGRLFCTLGDDVQSVTSFTCTGTAFLCSYLLFSL
ncbi:SWI/SNF-related matrix-associated actin-dependent regulator of chromatin subfamily A containing DEAD/H box 1-like [Egretta garzetta]|uniref:SWI/SNF-related matrix-associated actin-dependent regulator of chromatin subfamily A containing DEAD/H box 1-like n=1 Tax=Egretta garzetta TaxID=188379 RepID=UPI00163C42D7|nr:SWI/SNF-related matrix-associated actin-dependent regulator of chromatin subfamily A containing DEAD/H box 1-like [Egretta garzetta]